MELNSFFFRQPKPTYTLVSISLLPNSELINVPKIIEQEQLEFYSCVGCTGIQNQQYRNIPILLSRADPPSSKYILYFHAMSEDMKDAYDLLLPIKQDSGVNIILVEYPGYGIYKEQEPSAQIITEDAEAVYDYILTKRKIPQCNIIVMGRSMGSGPACYLADKFCPNALILISPYMSFRKVAEHFVGSTLSKLVDERFENIQAIRNVQCPLLTIHGQKDDIIPMEHSTQLLSFARSRIKQFHFPEKMVNKQINLLIQTHDKFDYVEDFQKFISQFFKKINFISDRVVKIEPLTADQRRDTKSPSYRISDQKYNAKSDQNSSSLYQKNKFQDDEISIFPQAILKKQMSIPTMKKVQLNLFREFEIIK